MKNKLKVAIYARVSTLNKGQNTETQLLPLREFCQRNGYQVIEEYVDNGISGTKESRPAFDEMLEAMRTRKINCVLVYKLDRIGRSLPHLLKLFEEFKKRKVEFISLTQNINSSTPEGKMFLRMLMVLASYERELIISRINSGLDLARSQGKKLGRPLNAKDKGKRRRSGYYLRFAKQKNGVAVPSY